MAQSKESIIQERIIQFKKQITFWKKDRSGQKEPQLGNLEEFIEDQGLDGLSICMNKEEDIKETVCNDIYIYLTIKVRKMENMLAENNIDLMLLVKY